MKSKEFTKRFFDNFESYICQFLLGFFVILLFIQIVLRQTFGYTISWGEELARFAFVWFVYFGASYAARLGAHNRVTIQLRLLPGNAEKYIEALADCIWILFNVVMIYKSTMLIASMMRYTYISPTLGWSMAYVYMIFPLSFAAKHNPNGIACTKVFERHPFSFFIQNDRFVGSLNQLGDLRRTLENDLAGLRID